MIGSSKLKLINIPESVLFDIVRHSIKIYIESGEIAGFDSLIQIYPELESKLGSFVTLYLNHNLKGCIGRIEGETSLLDDLTSNAIDAAFHDSRFMPLAKNELPIFKIEISILTKPEILRYRDEKDLFLKLGKDKPGVIIEYRQGRSTYLPQVWESYSDTKLFMSELAIKGGFEEKIWDQKGCIIKTYQAQIYEEK